MTRDLDDMLDWVKRLIARRYQGHSELDDLMQEGRIAVWRAWSDGERDHQRLIYKAMNRAGDLLKQGQPFGKPRADRAQNTARGAATREKLRAFILEYVKLHSKRPTYREMSEACGISLQSASTHYKRLYLFSGVPEEMTVESFDRFPDLDGLGYFAVDPGFDDDTVNRLLVQDLMTVLSDTERLAIYLRYWEDQTYPAIGKVMGRHPTAAEDWVKKGLKTLKAHAML